MIISNYFDNRHYLDEISKILIFPELNPALLREKEVGKYQLAGQNWFYMIQAGYTRSSNQNKGEFHKAYGDIQMVIEGTESIHFRTLKPTLNELKKEPKSPDLFLVDNDFENASVILNKGEYAVFFPGEVHKPMCNTNGESHFVKKLVVKFPFNVLGVPSIY